MRRQLRPKRDENPKKMELNPTVTQASVRIRFCSKISERIPPAKIAAVNPSHAKDAKSPV
jgi:hypothetical protein